MSLSAKAVGESQRKIFEALTSYDRVNPEVDKLGYLPFDAQVQSFLRAGAANDMAARAEAWDYASDYGGAMDDQVPIWRRRGTDPSDIHNAMRKASDDILKARKEIRSLQREAALKAASPAPPAPPAAQPVPAQ